MEELGFYKTDCESLWSQIKHQKKQIQLKRRWLLGLPTSKSEQKKFERPDDFLNDASLHESFLREDDMFYETVKSCVNAAFGVCDTEAGNRVFQDGMQFLGTPNISRALASCLDDLTTKGLYLFATILTGGLVKFEKTRWKMKRVIRESLPEVFGSQDNHNDQKGISQKLSQLLNDPQYFRDNFITFSSSRSQSHRAAVRKVLDGLQDLPYETLFAMYRKLRGQKGIPQLQPRKSVWSRDYLINQVKRKSERMLSEVGIGDELQEPLAKAMAVVGLSHKLIPGFRNSIVTEFHQFSPEIKILQDEIARAVWLVKTKIGIPELKNLKILLDSNAKVSNRSLRTAIKRMLTEYLFGCADMGTVPKSLLETLTVINRNSQNKLHRRIQKDEIEEEVECIVIVSAQIKQIVWDMFPDCDLDLDFDDAYMEEMESGGGDDDDDDDDDVDRSDGDDNDRNVLLLEEDEAESTGESTPFLCKPPTAKTTRNDCYPRFTPNDGVFVNGLEPMFSTQEDSVDSDDIKRGFDRNSIERQETVCNTGVNTENELHLEPEDTHGKKTTYKNQYLAIQEVSDETSMIAYNLIGHMLEEFAQAEGLDLDWDDSLYLKKDCVTREDSQVVEEKQTLSQENDDGSIIVQIIEDLIPSFSKSGKEGLRKSVGLL